MNRAPLVWLLLLVSLPVFAQTAPPDPRRELPRLEKLAARRIRNADLHYNLGVAYYQSGNPGKATLEFLRALDLDSAHPQARQNLAYLQNLDPDLVSAPAQPFLLRVLLNLYDWFNLDRLAVLVLLAALLATLCAHWLFHYPPDRERGLPLLFLGLALTLLLISAAALLVKDHRWRTNPKAVVMRDGAAFHAAGTGDRVLRLLPEGSVLIMRSDRGSRLQAILADGTPGWIAPAEVERVRPPATE